MLHVTIDTIGVGYKSEAAFNRAFKREFGLPPALYRRRLAANDARLPATLNGGSSIATALDALRQSDGGTTDRSASTRYQ
jgi:hypothetical protein